MSYLNIFREVEELGNIAKISNLGGHNIPSRTKN